MSFLVLYNPACGDRLAKSFLDEHVIPLLQENGKAIDQVSATEKPGHAGTLVIDYLEAHAGEVTIILGSGDGTLHEIINMLSGVEIKGVREGAPASKLYFVLVPCGTANALYSSLFPPSDLMNSTEYRLQSVRSYISGSRTIPLTLAITTLSAPPFARARPKAVISAVVVSTSLHASILRDSESLREEMPGIERFKVAAEKNSTRWYNSWAKLLPMPGAGIVQIYDPVRRAFVAHPESDIDNPVVDLDGPFAYFLSTVNVDRLEPAFKITPLERQSPPEEASCDIVIVRPQRDPSILGDSEEARVAFVDKLWAVLGSAYREGGHIDLRYTVEGEITTDGDGPTVVEYVRCGGWEWDPYDEDEAAHLLCSDGTISVIEKGGRAVCLAASPSDTAGFMVYV